MLDPLHFGAGNSFHQSMYYGTPTVTLTSNYLKAKVVKGAYDQMKLENAPVSNSIDEYVDLSIEIANLDKKKALEKNYVTLIIADHGNCETMINPDGSPNTAHTKNPVPIILVDAKKRKIKSGTGHDRKGY